MYNGVFNNKIGCIVKDVPRIYIFRYFGIDLPKGQGYETGIDIRLFYPDGNGCSLRETNILKIVWIGGGEPSEKHCMYHVSSKIVI